MKRKSLLFFLPALFFLTLFWQEGNVNAATFYVRTDGGTDQQCTGLADSAYPGSGTAQSCAWSHPFYALDGAAWTWTIQGGDTLVIHDGSYMIGYGAPNTSAHCDTAFPWDCTFPALPSGPNSGTPTRIVGAAWDTGCGTRPELWGTERASQILSLTSTSNAVVACLEITDHSSCVEDHQALAGGATAVTCSKTAYPYGDWAATGIVASNSSNVLLRGLNIHGLANTGIWAGGLTDWTVEGVRIAGNGWVGWNGDIGAGSSNSGTLTFRDWIVEWNGCAETYPGLTYDQCWAQQAGGYGDGVGTASTGGDWIIENSVFRYNTSDGLDLLYLGVGGQAQASATVRRSRAYGNAGNQMKIAATATIINSLLIGNCSYFSGQPFAQQMDSGDICRALGNTLALSPHVSDNMNVINSTIVGEGDCLGEIICDTADCTGSEAAVLQNNIFRAYTDWRQPWENSCFLWDPSNFNSGNNDYNIVYNAKDNEGYCAAGANNNCSSDPLFVNGTLASFDGDIQSGSPAVDTGLAVGSLGGLVPAEDIDFGARPTGGGVDRGAYEYGAVPAPELLISCTPASLTIAAGGNDTTLCTLTSLNGYNNAVTLSCEGLPVGGCLFSANPVTPPANGTNQSTVTVNVDSGAPSGTFPFLVSGTDGVIHRIANVSLTVGGAGTYLLSDDFGDGVLDWTGTKGQWAESGGLLTGTTNRKADRLANLPWPDSGTSSCSDCTVEADIRLDSAPRASLLAWYQDKRNLVEVRLFDDRNKVLFLQKSNGLKAAKKAASLTINAGVTYHVVVSYSSGNFQVSVDGVSLFTVPTDVVPSGNVGFRVKSLTGTNVSASFDSILVY